MNRTDLIKEVLNLKLVSISREQKIGTIETLDSGDFIFSGIKLGGSFNETIKDYIRQKHLGNIKSEICSGMLGFSYKYMTDDQKEVAEIIAIQACNSINGALAKLAADSIK